MDVPMIRRSPVLRAFLVCALAVISAPAAATGGSVETDPAAVIKPGLRDLPPDSPELLKSGRPVVTAATSFARNLTLDFAAQGTYPVRLARNEPRTFLAGVVGLAALISTDPVTRDAIASPSIRDRYGRSAQEFSSYANGRNSAILFLGIGAVGVITKSDRERATGVMLAEAMITSGVWTEFGKRLTGRERPRETTGYGSDWTGPGAIFTDEQADDRSLASFPSGHATGIWAMATVLAHQYPAHRVVPVLAYGTAAAMSYSRMVVNAHWLSDVVVGGLIGYGCAKQVIGAHEERRAGNEGARETSPSPEWRVTLDVRGDYRGVGLAIDL